jgi:hypothetical protein
VIGASGDHLEAAYYLGHRSFDPMRASGRPINDSILDYMRELDLTWEMAHAGHELDSGREQSDPWISTQVAAQILELSKRQTRRLKPELEGQLFNGRLMFRESKVREYAGKRDGRTRPGV